MPDVPKKTLLETITDKLEATAVIAMTTSNQQKMGEYQSYLRGRSAGLYEAVALISQVMAEDVKK